MGRRKGLIESDGKLGGDKVVNFDNADKHKAFTRKSKQPLETEAVFSNKWKQAGSWVNSGNVVNLIS